MLEGQLKWKWLVFPQPLPLLSFLGPPFCHPAAPAHLSLRLELLTAASWWDEWRPSRVLLYEDRILLQLHQGLAQTLEESLPSFVITSHLACVCLGTLVFPLNLSENLQIILVTF